MDLYGPFDTDGALDWETYLRPHDDLSEVRKALDAVETADWPYSWAAAELVARLGGYPRGWFPEGIIEWMTTVEDQLTRDDVLHAYSIAEELLLRDIASLWADGDKWVVTVLDLRRRLRALATRWT